MKNVQPPGCLPALQFNVTRRHRLGWRDFAWDDREPLNPCGDKLCLADVIDIHRCVIHICSTMKTATVRDLRNQFPRVAAWIENGEEVSITKSGKLFARLVPVTPAKKAKFVKPDIMARLKETWGDRIFSTKEVEAMRAAEFEDEEG